jgi:hypothetical protein
LRDGRPMKLPIPGSSIGVLLPCTKTVTASDAVRKNQPPPIDIMAFHTSPIIDEGTSSFQKRCHLVNRYIRAASSSSSGCAMRE